MEFANDPPRLNVTHQSREKVTFARKLRRNLTESERILWEAIRARKLGCKFRRQTPLGNFVVDFCCLQHRLIIEVDGDIHVLQKEYDHQRDDMLTLGKFTVLRFRNEEIFGNLSNVLERIKSHCLS